MYSKEYIKDKLTISDYFRHVIVKIDSDNYIGNFDIHKTDHIRCPLHNDKTGSFAIFKNDKAFKCFGSKCLKSGDIIKLHMLYTGDTFMDTLDKLSRIIDMIYKEDTGIDLNKLISKKKEAGEDVTDIISIKGNSKGITGLNKLKECKELRDNITILAQDIKEEFIKKDILRELVHCSDEVDKLLELFNRTKNANVEQRIRDVAYELKNRDIESDAIWNLLLSLKLGSICAEDASDRLVAIVKDISTTENKVREEESTQEYSIK